MDAGIDRRSLLETLVALRQSALERENDRRSDLNAVHPSRSASAANLVHYLTVRSVDLREAQLALSRLGLSSLGRAEAHTIASLDAVISRLSSEIESALVPNDLGRAAISAGEGVDLLAGHATQMFGPPSRRHLTRLMVTLPTEAAGDPALVRSYVERGMAVARINCAHDGPEQWQAMAHNVQLASHELGRRVRIACDLAGPKPRTGHLEPGAEVLKVKPTRDELGRVLAPAVLRLTTQPYDPTITNAIPICEELVANAETGDRLRFVDARGRKRSLEVTATSASVGDTADTGNTWLEVRSDRTSYLLTGTEMRLVRAGEVVEKGLVGRLPAKAQSIALGNGDLLELRFGTGAGGQARLCGDGSIAPPFVTISIAELFDAIEVGHRVLLDDGLLSGHVIDKADGSVLVEMNHDGRLKLKAEKGINLPDTPLEIPALTEDDVAALEVVARFADHVAISFVAKPVDVLQLQGHLDRLGASDTGVILKIERREAFEALPELLLAALRRPPAAVMVARGDLAVEVGFERLAELQEEILWLCEAAHVPVIWATQVLETLAKSGAPTRAEITDAARASRAECVMLNKGPHIPAAMELLDDILSRMHAHQIKRTPMLRPLSIAGPGPLLR